MNLYINSLFNEYCYKTKIRTSFELEPNESPYHDIDDLENEELEYRLEYVDSCVKTAHNIWDKCNFSNELIVLYEDKYSCHEKNEKEFIENTLQSLDCREYHLKWNDDEEIYEGIRYIWKTDKINTRELFKGIILSDIGGNTELDCAVYIIDNQTKNVFFLYDDRGIDVYSDDKNFMNKDMHRFLDAFPKELESDIKFI